jgi:hypothetical protein
MVSPGPQYFPMQDKMDGIWCGSTVTGDGADKTYITDMGIRSYNIYAFIHLPPKKGLCG